MALTQDFGGLIATPAPTSVAASSTPVTLSVAETLNSVVIASVAGIQLVTTETAANILAAYPAVQVGGVLGFFSVRDTDPTGSTTVAGGTGCTIIGAATLNGGAVPVNAGFLVVKASSTTVTIYRIY